MSVGAVSEQSAGSDYNTSLHFPHRTGQKRKHSNVTVRGGVADVTKYTFSGRLRELFPLNKVVCKMHFK